MEAPSALGDSQERAVVQQAIEQFERQAHGLLVDRPPG